MLGYVTLGTNDLAKAVAFYAAHLRDLDGNKLAVLSSGTGVG